MTTYPYNNIRLNTRDHQTCPHSTLDIFINTFQRYELLSFVYLECITNRGNSRTCCDKSYVSVLCGECDSPLRDIDTLFCPAVLNIDPHKPFPYKPYINLIFSRDRMVCKMYDNILQ